MKKFFEGKKINGEKVVGKTLVGVQWLSIGSHAISIASITEILKSLKDSNISKGKKTALTLVYLALAGYSVYSIRDSLKLIDQMNEELDEMNYIEERK